MEEILQSGVSDLVRSLADRYAIERVVASGGMADVYLATDLRHQRKVAIKVLRRETVGRLERQRFLREITIAANLSHPNIVPLFDSGQVGPHLYYVMPYVEGQSLRDRLARDRSVPLEQALAITTEAADALIYAHERGIIHRDIKPGNILLEAGHARVTDFGIAKALEAAGSDSLTTGQVALGTLAYMSPEQAVGSAEVDARCDQYALALVLYEMLCGELPFGSDAPEVVVTRKALGELPPPRASRGTLPEHIRAAIVRALAPSPDLRFSSVAEFVAALRDDSLAYSLRARWRRRLIPVAVAVAAVALLGALLARGSLRGDSRPVPAPAVGLGRIVVAPLHNGTDSASLDVVGLMAGDWLTEGLQKTGILEVAPTSSVFEIDSMARRMRAPARILAEETGAGTVVSGAYYRRRDSLLFRLQVADEAGQRVVGTITDVAAPIADPIRGVEELRNRLMGWLAMHYDERLQVPAGAERPPTYEAYRAFSEGMTQYIASQNARATPLFLDAFRKDSSFVHALLYASLSLTNVTDWSRADSLLRIVDRRRSQLSEYDRAWLDFRLGIIRGDGAMALTAMRTAARLAPASKAGYNHAVAAFQNGYVHEALRGIESLQPDRGSMRGFASYWSIYGSIVHALGDYDREHGVGLAARAAYPDRLIAFPPFLRALAAKGKLLDLASALREAERLPPDPYYWDHGLLLTEVAEELRAHGHPRESATYYEQLRSWLGERDSVPSMKWRLVQTLYAMHRWDEARAQLVQLRRAHPDNVDYVGMTGLLASRSGQRAVALAVADSLARRRRPYEFGAAELYQARIAATLGDRESAVSALRQSFTKGRPYHLWLHREMDLDPLRGYAPFDQIVRGRD